MSFKEPFKSKRCLISINGWYEWLKENKSSKAYFMKPTKDNYFACAGIYDEWFDSATGKMIRTVALITTKPNEVVTKIHDRMPVILDRNDWSLWLHSKDLVEVNKLLKTCPDKLVSYHEVSDFVNKVKNDSKECIEKYKNKKPKLGQLSLF